MPWFEAPAGVADTPAGKASSPLLRALAGAETLQRVGRVAEAWGTLVRVTGINAAIGELCLLEQPETGFQLTAEVVGISRNHTLLTPLGPLEGISAATTVTATGRQASVPVGSALLGRILDAHGEPLDGLGPIDARQRASVYAPSPNPLKRKLIDRPLETGVRAIDGVLSVGEGQRLGIFATAGGGKSTLLGMLARGARSDVNVIVLVGERGREVREFIEDSLGPEGLQRSVVVVATSDRPALERSRVAYVGTAIAEYFRDQGMRVMLMMDSVTRFARALRDVGLAMGEPPTRRGFTPSVFSSLPRLFERAGNNDRGTITAFYTVLIEEEEGSDPIGEEVRSILDGHIYLSKKLAAANHYPAIDILSSASRVMTRVTSPEHQAAAGLLRRYLAKYREIELLIQLGEYRAGNDPEADVAVAKINEINDFLRQPAEALSGYDDAVVRLIGMFR
ncbi:type III secretion system ATPase SctN [Dokdonella sp.]|uniref:type III secretion system ATPase SctN n=1 Tax=Dokdonella sp. TaxID=2291710 RepID=UPI00260F34CF|nr:type III secretion system ATPase SctN [Dokdonella sp.]